MNRLLNLWRKLKGLKLALIAGVLTGAEGLVAVGVELPGSSYIPLQYRGMAIIAVAAAAFVMRTLAARAEAKRGQ